MKYAPELYAEAFLVVCGATADHNRENALVHQLIRVMEKNGDIGRREKIFAAIRRAYIKKNGGREVVIETARRQHIDFGQYFKKEDAITTAIHPDLIAGVRITIDGERELDMSLNRKLAKML